MSLLTQASICITPNGYKEGTLYSVIPSDGSGDMSVVRATTATRVNSAGLVELVPYNLVQYSQDFSNAAWASSQVAIASNSTTAPDGTLTAETLTASTSNAAHYIFQGINTNSGSTVTFSCFVKNNGGNYVQLLAGGIPFTISNPYQNFNLINGTLAQGNIPTSTIENVGNGWFRISYTVEAISSGSGNYLLCPILSGTTGRLDAFTGNGTSGIFIWGAQLVEGTLPLNYLRTETRLNIPRLDYSNGTCPSLLVEPQRTNLFNYSQQFDNAAWTKIVGGSITANVAISPSGLQDADLFNNANVYQQRTQANDTMYCFSVYVKKNTSAYVSIGYLDNVVGFVGGEITYTYLTNTITVIQSANGSVSGQSIDVGNGWIRLILKYTTIATVTFNYQYIDTNGSYVWGAQLEAGSYPTSYIPTTSASVTRNADQVFKTGITSLIGQTEGTIYLEADIQKHNDSEFYVAISNGASLGEAIYLYQPSGGILQVLFRTGGATPTISILNANWNIGFNKIAIAYNSTSGEVFINGASQGTVALSALPTCSQLTIGARPDAPGSLVGSGGYKVATLWKTRLTNDQLELLTGNSFNTYAEMASYYNYTLQ